MAQQLFASFSKSHRSVFPPCLQLLKNTTVSFSALPCLEAYNHKSNVFCFSGYTSHWVPTILWKMCCQVWMQNWKRKNDIHGVMGLSCFDKLDGLRTCKDWCWLRLSLLPNNKLSDLLYLPLTCSQLKITSTKPWSFLDVIKRYHA